MANHYVPETPTFNAGVRKFETTDRNHADTLNVPIAQLVENDNYLKKELEKKANQDEQNKIYTVSELSGQSLKNAKMYFVKVQRGQTVTQIGQYSIFKENNAQITSLKGNTNTDKVYSLYFDSSKNGFFLRASATGTVAADHVLAGKTFSSETDTDQTGTMINRGNWGATLDSAGQIVVPNGYHDGTGIVKANTISGRTIMPGQNEQLVIEAGKLATGDIRVSGDSNLSPDNIRHGSNIFGTNGRFTSDATAETYHLQEGKTAYVRGQKIIGTQPWRGNQIQSVTPSRQNQRVSIQGGIHQGGGYIDVVGDSDLIPANIRQGTNLFGVSGTYDGGRSQIANALTNKGVPTSTSATAEQIVSNINKLPIFREIQIPEPQGANLNGDPKKKKPSSVRSHLNTIHNSIIWEVTTNEWESKFARCQTQIDLSNVSKVISFGSSWSGPHKFFYITKDKRIMDESYLQVNGIGSILSNSIKVIADKLVNIPESFSGMCYVFVYSENTSGVHINSKLYIF